MSDVWLSRTSGLSREQRGLGRPKLAQRQPTSHVTWTPLSRSKGQGHQAALFSAALTRNAAAAVSVETYSAWESTATLRLLGGERRGRRGAGYIVSPRAQLVSYTEWKRFQILHLIVPAKHIRNQFWFHAPIECVLSMSGVVAVYWYSLDGGTICCWPRSPILPWLQRSTNHLLTYLFTYLLTYLLTYLSLLQMGVDIWLYHASKLVYWSCTASFDIFRSFKLLVFPDDDEWCCYAILTCIRKLEASI